MTDLRTFDLAREIESLRDHFRWNQSDLAEALGVSQGAVSDWERGQYPPSAEMLVKIGNISQGQTAIKFWMHAGIDATRLIAAVGSFLRAEDVPPTQGQLSKFPELGPTTEIGIATAQRILRLTTKEVVDLAKSGKITARKVRSTYVFEYGSVVDFSARTRKKA